MRKVVELGAEDATPPAAASGTSAAGAGDGAPNGHLYGVAPAEGQGRGRSGSVASGRRPSVSDVIDNVAELADTLAAESSAFVKTLRKVNGNDPSHPQRSMSALLEEDEMDSLRAFLYRVVTDKVFDTVMGIVIIFNIVLMMIEANLNAGCSSATCTGPGSVVFLLNVCLLFIYTLEALARLYVLRASFLINGWCLLDSVIVIFAFVDLSLSLMGADVSMKEVQMLRILRIARLIRAIKLLKFFPELYIMVQGFKFAFMAMVWGFLMIIILLVLWSLVYVEIVNPIVKDFPWARHGVDTDWCSEAFSSIESSSLLMFQTLVAGDSWGTCMVPIIREWPGTFLLFAPSLISISLGFTNLILAVIVDRAAQAREEDEEQVAKQAQVKEREIIRKWGGVLQSMDENGDGVISMSEIVHSFQTSPDIAQTLKVLDVKESDLEQLFKLMDEDQNGTLSPDEFVGSIRKAQSQDPRMYLMFMKLQLSYTMRMVEAQKRAMEQLPQTLLESLGHGPRKAEPPQPSAPARERDPVPRPEGKDSGCCTAVAFDEKREKTEELLYPQPVLGAGNAFAEVVVASSPAGHHEQNAFAMLSLEGEFQRLQEHLDSKFEALTRNVVSSNDTLFDRIRVMEASLSPEQVKPSGGPATTTHGDSAASGKDRRPGGAQPGGRVRRGVELDKPLGGSEGAGCQKIPRCI